MVTNSPRGRRLLAATFLLPMLALVPAAAPDPAGTGSGSRLAGDACGPARAKPDGEVWRCTFVDVFSGSTLDDDRWITQDTARTGFKSGLTCYRGADNVTVEDGELRLETRHEGAVLDCDNPYGTFRTPYTGAVISTRGHFSQTYGRFEVRARWPATRAPGLHGNFWMFPAHPTYGRWPASGEIDVAEWWSNAPTLVLPSLHYRGRRAAHDTGWGCRVADPSAFHTYAVEWAPTEMSFSIDDVVCFTRRWTPLPPLVAPRPFDHPFSLILLMGVGTADGLNAVTATTDLPAALTVDHVRAWE